MNKADKKAALELLSFINKSNVSFLAIENIVKILEDNGFDRLDEGEAWNIKKGGRYFIEKNKLCVAVFAVGSGSPEKDGFRIIGAHADSPGFKIKPNPVMEANGYAKLNVEPYGSPILSTWCDRPLSCAGKVVLRSENPLKPLEVIINLKKPLLVIPNLSIHFNREINDGYKYSKQVDMLPFMGIVSDELGRNDRLLRLICKELKVKADDILDYELFLYDCNDGILFGADEELISCGRLDDLWMAHAGLKAILASKETPATKILTVFDAEEVGSGTQDGASSMFLYNIISRLTGYLSKTEEARHMALSNSVLVSADLAHALHPNLPEKSDPVNRPLLGKGPVIKYSGNQRYATTAKTASIFMEACKRAEVPYQVFTNRSDSPGGSTIGPMMSALFCVDTVDIGAPIFGMHSIRETGAVMDNSYTEAAFKAFYEL